MIPVITIFVWNRQAAITHTAYTSVGEAMKKSLVARTLFTAGSIIAFSNSAPPAAEAELVCRPCPFTCDSTGARDADCGERRSRQGQCCVDLDNRGLEALEQRDRQSQRSGYRYDYESDKNDNRYYYDHDHRRHVRPGNRNGNRSATSSMRLYDPGAYDDRNGYNPGDCPQGFHVNDRGCNDDERRRGCKDQNSPSGRICVGW